MKTIPPRLFALLLFALLVLPTAVTGAALQVPALKSRVNDYAGMLQPATRQQLEQVLRLFEEQESTQIAVLTINTLGGDSLEEFSLRVAETWKIGQKEQDNGALLLIVRNDRKLRIEVGYGLEGSLTDLIAGRIIRDVITPHFRQGNFDQGVINGVNAMIDAVRGEFTSPQTVSRPKQSDDLWGMMVAVLFFPFMVIGRLFRSHVVLGTIFGGILVPAMGMLAIGFSWLILIIGVPLGMFVGFLASKLFGASGALAMGHYHSGGRSSWGSGGGFSGGGGGFGGGGASGGW